MGEGGVRGEQRAWSCLLMGEGGVRGERQENSCYHAVEIKFTTKFHIFDFFS